MSACTDYDGLCGIHARGATSSKQVRCHYEFAHGGPCSWTTKKLMLTIFGGITREEVIERAAKGSPAAKAILGIK